MDVGAPLPEALHAGRVQLSAKLLFLRIRMIAKVYVAVAGECTGSPESLRQEMAVARYEIGSAELHQEA